MDFIKKALEIIKRKYETLGKKKLIENSIIIIIIGIIALITGGYFSSNDKAKVNKSEEGQALNSEMPVQGKSRAEDLEERMEFILSKIHGAGDVNVMITFESGRELVPAYDLKNSDNETEEKDGGGGSRSIKNIERESKMVFGNGKNGSEGPVIIKEIEPKALGVVITAEGAKDPVIKDSLYRAAEVLLDIPIHKIQVFPKK